MPSYRISRSNDTIFIVLLLLISLIPLWAASRHHTLLNDDTYITLTYVKNLVAGNGFVYNAPPATLGTTTPLFVLSVSVLVLIFPFIEIPVLATFLTAFCWLGVAWVFYFFRHAWRLDAWQVVIIAATVAATGWVYLLGMEMYLFSFLLVLTLSLFLRQNYLLAGLSSGLLFLTRGEGALVLLLLQTVGFLQLIRDQRRLSWSALKPAVYLGLGFALPVGLWFLYAWLTFGYVLPNTLEAKQAQRDSLMFKSLPAALWHQWLPNWGRPLKWTFPLLDMTINFWWLGVGLGVISSLLRRQVWLLLLLWVGAYFIGYTLLDVAAYAWYKVPILFVLNLFFALGLIQIGEWLLVSAPAPLNLSLVVVVFCLALFYLGNPIYRDIMHYPGDRRGEDYLRLSRWIRENIPEDKSLAYIEIGYIGYYTDHRIIDLAGLIFRDIPPHIAERDFAWGFWKYQPDYYIHTPHFDRSLRQIHEDPKFQQQYEPVKQLPAPHEKTFTIWKRLPPDTLKSQQDGV